MADNMQTKPKKKKKVWLIVLVIVAVLAVVIGIVVHNMTKTVEKVSNTVEVEPVQLRDLSDTISLKGTVSGENSVNVTSKATAEITAVNVQLGDIVKEGDVLVTLDSASIQEKIAELEKTMANSNAVNSINSRQTSNALVQAQQDQTTQLAEAQKAIERAEQAYNVAQATYDASQKTDADFASLLSAKQAIDDAKEAYDKTLESTNRAIETAKIQLELDRYKDSDSSSKDTLNSLREQLEDCEIKAACGGVVTAVNVKVGDINTEKVTMLTIENTASLKMSATVQEADILRLQEGQTASVTADATGDEEIKGEVTRVVRVKSAGSADGSGQVAAGGYSVEISLDTKELLVGMDVKARVMLKEKGSVLAVPYDLVRYDEDGSAYVLVAESGSDGFATAVRKNITVGETVDYYVEVTGGDLAEGDKLIYDYTGTVTEGQSFAPEQMYSEQMMEGINGAGDGAGGEVVE